MKSSTQSTNTIESQYIIDGVFVVQDSESLEINSIDLWQTHNDINIKLEPNSKLIIYNQITQNSNSKVRITATNNTSLKIFSLYSYSSDSKLGIEMIGSDNQIQLIEIANPNQPIQVSSSQSVVSNSSGNIIEQYFGCISDYGSSFDINYSIDIGMFADKNVIKQYLQSTNFGQVGKTKFTPSLHILSPSAKVNHGVSYGKIDKHQANYLKSRGLSDQETQRLLGHVFCNRYLEYITEICVRQEFERAIFGV
jgi:SUF system FeS cluster assembly, SufBD